MHLYLSFFPIDLSAQVEGQGMLQLDTYGLMRINEF